MARECQILQIIKDTQESIFETCKNRGLSLRAIHQFSGIPYSTLRSYAGHSGETAEMGITALRKLVGVVPNELLSLLLPDSAAIFKVPDAMDHSEVADCFTQYLATKNAAHHPNSPAGVDISDCEDRALRSLAVVGGK